MESACDEIIKLEILDKDEKEMGGVKLAAIELSLDEQGILSDAEREEQAAKLGELFAKIEARELPKEYPGGGPKHQPYVERIMASLPEDQRGRVGRLFNQRRKLDVPMENAGNVFIKILDFVAEENKPAPAAAGPHVHRLDSPKRAPFDAFAYVNRIPDKPHEDESPRQFAGRIHGRLANQEGRIQLKLPPGMDRAAYDGFKTFLGSEGNPRITNCFMCHSAPEFVAGEGSLRNLKQTEAELASIIRGKMAKAADGAEGYAGLKIDDGEVAALVSFLQSLNDVSDERFRNLILEAKVTDVTAEAAESAPALRGTVRFEGPRPERKPVPMDEPSRKLHEAQPLDESILVSESGGLANVFVYVKNPAAGDYPPPAKPAIIDQQGSIFRPRVQGLRVGQQVLMKNGDPFIHNIRSLSKRNRPFNIAQPPNSPDREKVFEEPEGPITIKCDFHRWMEAHFWVMDHPFFAVTDDEGKFEISNLPTGDFELVAWHEELGEQEIKVAVGGDGAIQNVLFRTK